MFDHVFLGMLDLPRFVREVFDMICEIEEIILMQL